MRNFWISAGVQYTSYIVLTINFRAIAHGQYAEAAATAMLATLLSYTIVRRIQQGESKTTLAGMMVGGHIGGSQWDVFDEVLGGNDDGAGTTMMIERLHEPTVFEPVTMKDVGDCAICCLSMLLGKTYRDILDVCPKRSGAHRIHPTRDGLNIKQMCLVGKRLGFDLEYYDEPDQEHRIGILDLQRTTNDEEGHVVMFARDTIYNPADGEFWTHVDAFLHTRKWKVEGFLWRKQ